MEKYTTFCTEEQTRKALELGAPIRFKTLCHYDLQDGKFIPYPDLDIDINGEPILIPPTAEQMIGWLESHDSIFSIEITIVSIAKMEWRWRLFAKGIYKTESLFSSPKEATLAAIDAALEYLSKNKK